MAVRDSETGNGGGERQEPIEVEVERLNQEGTRYSTASSYGRAIGPVLAGFIIDVLDFATFGSAGLYLGFLLGWPAGWYLARSFGLDRRLSLYVALACGVYCTIPITSPIPFATLIGVWLRARQPA
jgi:hypothetical protein